MGEAMEAKQEEPANTCCAALKRKYTKLVKKYSKCEEVKNEFRVCTAMVEKKYDVIEKENENLKQSMEKLKSLADTWKDEKEQESAIRVDLEDEVSALKEEIQLLKQNGNYVSREANEQHQEHVNVSEKEINRLKELLESETRSAALEKKNAELQRKKVDEAMKKLQMEKNKANEAHKVANMDRKKAEENRLLWEKLKTETDALKLTLASERSKSEDAEKKVEAEKHKAIEERKRADLAVAKAEEQRKLAETNLKKVMFEKDQADDLIRLLKQNGNSVSQEANDQLQERVNVGEKEINRLKELLECETRNAALEKKNAELQRKKVDEALKKVQMEKNKAIEARKVANMERKKAEENRLMWEKLKTETDALKLMLASERSKSEAADKKVEAEKQKAIEERKRADLAVAKAEEQRKLAETNLKKALFEKNRADDLIQKLEAVRSKAEKSEDLRKKNLCSDKLLNARADAFNTGKNAEITSDVCVGMVKNDALMSHRMEEMLLEKGQNIVKEKKRSDTQRKKAKEQKKVARAHKRMAIKEKHRADQLSRELETCKLRLEELQKELRDSASYRKHAVNSHLRYDNVISESDTVRLLKKQLKLEKMLVKHAKKATKVESVRNNVLHQELIHLKHVFSRLQHHLEMLDDTFLHGSEGTHQLEKVGNLTSTRDFFGSDGHPEQFISGIKSGLDPPYRGSNRTMLQSSAINSSSASFSELHSVGSQERGVFSVTTSAKLGEDVSNLKRTISRLSDKTMLRTNEHAVDKADNSIESPIKGSAKERRVGYHDENRILGAVKSVESLYSEGQKLHQRVSEKLSQLHGILDGQKDEPAKENLQENPCSDNVRPFKRRKTSPEESVVIHPFHDSNEQQIVRGLDIDQSDAFMRASPPGLDVMKSGECFQDGMDNVLEDRCIPQDFFEKASYDYMKLLDLDNAADEESYRIAIAKPLSPTLPEIEFQGEDKLQLDDDLEMQTDKRSPERLSTVKAPTPILDMPKNPINMELSGIVSFQLQTDESSIDCSKNINSLLASDAHLQQIHVSGGELELPDPSHFGNEETNILCESRIASTPGSALKYLVLSSDNKDNDSILRILQTMENCTPQCSLIHSAEIFLRSLLTPLLKAEDLSMKEKVCVFFSIMLHGIFEVGTNNWTNVVTDAFVQSLASLTTHICSALSDLVLRRMFMESCDLLELLALTEDFLLQRKVLVYGDVSSKSHVVCSSKVNAVLNGNAIVLSEVVSPAQLLVAGGSLLASLCLAIDHIGFVCEMSCNIFGMHKFEPSVLLAVLHAFAHICGSKYFTLEQYAVPMTVVKSLVMFLEKQAMSTNSTSSSHSMVETPSKVWLCSTTCPFSEGAVSIEDVALLLLKKLQNYGQSDSWPQNSLELMNSLIPRVWSHDDRTEEVSSVTSDENLCGLIDILSLVEILASFMSWSWTFDNIIGQICEWLESRLMEGFSAVIIVLLGQLGRVGVGASGYEDTRVEKLRGWLSAFLCNSTFKKLRIPIQLAIIDALLSLTPIKFDEILKDGAETPAVINQSLPVNSIREWFFQLSSQQQSAFRLNHGCW